MKLQIDRKCEAAGVVPCFARGPRLILVTQTSLWAENQSNRPLTTAIAYCGLVGVSGRRRARQDLLYLKRGFIIDVEYTLCEAWLSVLTRVGEFTTLEESPN